MLVSSSDAPESHVARRRYPTTGWPKVNAPDYQILSDNVCRATGLDGFVGLTMCEPQVRAAISIFEASTQRAIAELFERWYPVFLNRIMREVEVKNLRIETNSKMGGPMYARDPRKHELLRDEFFPAIMAGDFSAIEGCHTIINVRLQPEKLSKVREVPVVTPEGAYKLVKIEGELRQSPLSPSCFACRSRPVYNPNVSNNYKQVVDNSIHDAILRHYPFHHDMYARHRDKFRLKGYVLAVDVKHFERCVGALVGIRSRFIGEKYHQLQRLILSQPYLCVSTDWKTAKLLSPAPGYLTQLASGDSSVAALGKEALICIFADFYSKRYKLGDEEALQLTLQGGRPDDVAFLNYGDDNLLYGNRKGVDELYEYMARFLTVEPEIPSALIGWEYTHDDGFLLRDQSAIVNFWKPERAPGPPFRPYFYLGFYLRFKTFREYGTRNIDHLETLMWEVMNDFGITQEDVGQWAELEARIVGARGLPLNYVLGKTHLMTDEERELLGQSKTIGLTLSRQIFNDLVHPQFRKG